MTAALAQSEMQFSWRTNTHFDLKDGLLKLGVAARLCVEGGAPFLYEYRQGKPKWKPDEYDSPMSYPMTETSPESYPLVTYVHNRE